MNATGRTRVAIVGGGCAAMTAAFELTRPEHEGRFEVTVYQMGWRLGGKGASGRGPAGRIEEHGLHIWMGWYENAFGLMRDCYEELGRDASQPLASWKDAFSPFERIGVVDRVAADEWAHWSAVLPPGDGLPGDPLPDGHRWSVRDYMSRAARLIASLLETIRTGAPAPIREAASASSPDLLTQMMRYGELATLTGMVQGASMLAGVLETFSPVPQTVVTSFLDSLSASSRSLIEARLADDYAVRRAWQILDLTIATLRGALRFGLATDPRGFDAIDDYDCREWMRMNGASEASLDSGYLRALYDLGFSYEQGDPSRPRISAGQALRGMVRMFFTYRGAFFWRMNAGMGDVVFAPLYEVLARRGVRFEFFHVLRDVRIATDDRDGSRHVAALEFDVQAHLVDGREYVPLVDVGGLPSWPSAPDFRQLVGGEALRGERFECPDTSPVAARKVMKVSDDFDLVVLGIGLGAVPQVCREILDSNAEWQQMVARVGTVATQAFQVWLRDDMHALGWRSGPVALSGFVEPFDTWADMTHLIPMEAWPEPVPRALAYFCSVLPDADAARGGVRENVRDSAVRFLENEVKHLWPGVVAPGGGFAWDRLADPAGDVAAQGRGRFDGQFWSANVTPSDRYTLSLPGSSRYRISPLDRTYDNLTLAGDWTSCGFNAGCVEAAVMSGRLAAHALSGLPRLESIVGYDHP